MIAGSVEELVAEGKAGNARALSTLVFMGGLAAVLLLASSGCNSGALTDGIDAGGAAPDAPYALDFQRVELEEQPEEAEGMQIAVHASLRPKGPFFLFGEVAFVSGRVVLDDGSKVDFVGRGEVDFDWTSGSVVLRGIRLLWRTAVIDRLDVILPGYEVMEWDTAELRCNAAGETDRKALNGIELSATADAESCTVQVRKPAGDQVYVPSDLMTHGTISRFASLHDRDGRGLELYGSVGRTNLTASKFTPADEGGVRFPVDVRIRWPGSVREAGIGLHARSVPVQSTDPE